KRTQERAVPLVEVDAAIPPALSDIVGRCLERDPAARFASIQELVEELEVWQGKRTSSGRSLVAPRPPVETVSPVAAKRLPWKWVAAGIAALVLAVGTYFGVHLWSRSS